MIITFKGDSDIYTQILFSILWLFVGIMYLCGNNRLVSKTVRQRIDNGKLLSYMRKTGVLYCILSALGGCMAIVERLALLPLNAYVAIYITGVLIIISSFLLNNKKYTGHFIN